MFISNIQLIYRLDYNINLSIIILRYQFTKNETFFNHIIHTNIKIDYILYYLVKITTKLTSGIEHLKHLTGQDFVQ